MSNIQHEIRCALNPDGAPVKPSYGMKGKTGRDNQFTKAKKLGVEYVISDETRTKLSLATKGKKWSDEQRANQSARMKEAVDNNPDAYTSSNRGRTKQIEYDGLKFHGNWELDFYKWTKAQGLIVERKTPGFKYIWNGERTYFPDFYIPSKDLYIEIKGYETERDRAKWSQFPKQLCVLKEREIKQIRNNNFMF
jgi:hypothetical protein